MTEMAAAVNCTALDKSPDWIKFFSSLSSPVVRFLTISRRFAGSMLGSVTYNKNEYSNLQKVYLSKIVSRQKILTETKIIEKKAINI